MDTSSLFTYLGAMASIAITFFVIIFFVKEDTPKNLTRNLFIAAGVMAFARIFNFLYTAYFGFNYLPESKSELILDTAALFIYMISFVWYIYTLFIVVNYNKKKYI